MKRRILRNTNKRQTQMLQGKPHPDSMEFKRWLRGNIDHFTDTTWTALESTYSRAVADGQIIE